MKKEMKILLILHLVLFLALVIPFMPNPHHLRYCFPENRRLTLIEYLKTLILNLIMR